MMAGRSAEITTLSAGMALAAALLFAGCTEEQVDRDPRPAAATSPPIQLEEAQPPIEPEATTGAERKLQDWQVWWHHAREVLFSGIPLNAEQAREVDAIIAEELDKGAALQQRTAELKAARKARDSARIDAARTALAETRAQLKKTHEIYEELRALLSEDQRPAFDMNRARHVAESQAPAQEREAQTE